MTQKKNVNMNLQWTLFPNLIVFSHARHEVILHLFIKKTNEKKETTLFEPFIQSDLTIRSYFNNGYLKRNQWWEFHSYLHSIKNLDLLKRHFEHKCEVRKIIIQLQIG